ncbi:MAG: DUF3578 domain-containing protein [Clostridiales bacterium]|nr:DUF3578 domain-containing protein [Clostridiales bacterium]
MSELEFGRPTMKYYNKKIDMSLLKEGFTIPVELVNDFLVISEENPDKSDENGLNTYSQVRFIMNDQDYLLPIKKVSSQREHLYQIRYTPTNPFAIELNKCFKAIYNDNNDLTTFDTREEYLEFSIDTEKNVVNCKPYNRESIEKWQELLGYIGPEDSINFNDYKKSYKLVWIKSIINLLKTHKTTTFENLFVEALSIYKQLLSKGYSVEESLKDNNSLEVSSNRVRTIMTDAPMTAFGLSGFFSIDRNKKNIIIPKDLKNSLTNTNIKELEKIIDKKIEVYFMKKSIEVTGTLGENLQFVLDNYNDAIKVRYPNHEVNRIVTKESVSNLQDIITNDQFLVNGSVGIGNWSNVPWIAIMDKKETTSTQKGMYLVYLINKDSKIVYLSLAFGVTDFSKNLSTKEFKVKMKDLVEYYKSRLGIQMMDKEIDLGTQVLGKKYAMASIWYKTYSYPDLDDDERLRSDLFEALKIYERALKIKNGDSIIDINQEEINNQKRVEDLLIWTNNLKDYLESRSLNYTIESLKSIIMSMKTKPLVLLAGLSGTGKSKIVEGIANALSATMENNRYKMISVRPDWSDPSDLLGYVGLNDKFNPGPLAEFLYHANNTIEPCILCLDEMNLARVEHYFSDVLSVIETRKRDNENVSTDLLFSNEIFKSDDASRQKYSKLRLTDNVFIFGTVNMDDSTHPFSNKVLDRANTIEFNHIDLRSLPSNEVKKDFQMPLLKTSLIKSDYIRLDECLNHGQNMMTANQVIEILVQINGILKKQNLQFGYRVRDEIIYFVTQSVNHNMMNFDEAIDFCIYQKILPKVKGSGFQLKELINTLFEYCSDKKNSIDHGDGYQYLKMETDLMKNMGKYPVSTQKIVDIMKSYEVEGYATFWS